MLGQHRNLENLLTNTILNRKYLASQKNVHRKRDRGEEEIARAIEGVKTGSGICKGKLQ